MKNKLLLFVISLLLLSCENVYVNGNLDGMWKLQTVEADDTTYRPGNIYYSFQRHLVMLGEYFEEGFPNYYLAEFDREDGWLVMSNFYKYPVSLGICDKEELKKYFIFSDKVRFRIEVLNDEVLVMRDGNLIYNLRKW